MKRTPRSPQLVAPVLVTQLNCEAVIGVNERRYLESVLPLCEGHVIEIGKLRAVPVDVLLEKLSARVALVAERPSVERTAPQPTSADDVLADLGLRRSA